jgi:hypothetical protein
MQYPGKMKACAGGNGKVTGATNAKVKTCCPCADITSLTVTIEDLQACPCLSYAPEPYSFLLTGAVAGTFDINLTTACVHTGSDGLIDSGQDDLVSNDSCATSLYPNSLGIYILGTGVPGSYDYDISISEPRIGQVAVFHLPCSAGWCAGTTVICDNEYTACMSVGTYAIPLMKNGRAIVTFNA